MAESPTVAVTGAAGGIGREVCRAFAADGGRVVGLDVDRAGLASLGTGIEGVALDVTDPSAVSDVLGTIGPIDVLVHAAGITALGSFMDTPLEAFDRVLDVNVRGAVIVTAAALPGLIERGGRIGVLSSVAGFSPLLYRTAYAASKHALHGFFESLRVELADSGVSVTMICPSFVDTGIELRAAHRAAGATGSWTTTGKVMTPERLAGLIRTGVMGRRRLVLPSATARSAYVLSKLGPALLEQLMRRRIERPM